MINPGNTNIVTMVLAGGKGERLYPLTADRSKPSVPFGGNFRIIDFTIMNCVMSGIRRIHVLTQYHSLSLNTHIHDRWGFLSKELGEFIETVPPKLRTPTGFYRGTADSVYRNLDLLEASRPDLVLILSGDHVYRADLGEFVKRHLSTGADATVLCGEVSAAEASAFGIVRTDKSHRILQFIEKPVDPAPYSENSVCQINLGVYCFNTRFLVQRLVSDAKKRTQHDFGKDILPESLERGLVISCPFGHVSPDEKPYWQDVGSIDSYFQCHQDLLDHPPRFDLLDPRWPPGSRLREWVPARISTAGNAEHGWSLVCGGTEIDKAKIFRSVISPQVKIGAGAILDHCIVFNGVTIGAKARLRNAIIDEGVVIPERAEIGYGNDARQFTVSPNGVVVVERGYRFTVEEEPSSSRFFEAPEGEEPPRLSKEVGAESPAGNEEPYKLPL
ncbi:MAG: NTP transferase domain-containing protein [Planctomycetes bacterium]|nr:NTP transferase domain-containing protein [Planctomycetota bacterium]